MLVWVKPFSTKTCLDSCIKQELVCKLPRLLAWKYFHASQWCMCLNHRGKVLYMWCKGLCPPLRGLHPSMNPFICCAVAPHFQMYHDGIEHNQQGRGLKSWQWLRSWISLVFVWLLACVFFSPIASALRWRKVDGSRDGAGGFRVGGRLLAYFFLSHCIRRSCGQNGSHLSDWHFST